MAGYKQPFGKSYWLGAAMFVSALVQKRMQDEKRNKTTIGQMCRRQLANTLGPMPMSAVEELKNVCCWEYRRHSRGALECLLLTDTVDKVG